MAGITHVLETILYCTDLREAHRFYADVLGLRAVSDMSELGMGFRLSPTSVLLLFQPDESSKPGREVPSHGVRGPGHVGFAIEGGTLDAWRTRLQGAGVAIEQEVAWKSGARSVYVRDPSGNSVELIDGDLWPR